MKHIHNDCPFDPPPKTVTRKEVIEAIFWIIVSIILATLIYNIYVDQDDMKGPSNEIIRQNRSHW